MKKNNKQKIFFCHFKGLYWRKSQVPDLDPLVKDMDPRNRISEPTCHGSVTLIKNRQYF
jgi:hypothetical protein